MNDLIDRIRAYVAAISPYYCHMCEAKVIIKDMGCPNCKCMDYVHEEKETQADALLREVAALEPVKWRLRIGASDIWSTTDAEWEADFYGKQSGCPYEKNPLYTLTGATHD